MKNTLVIVAHPNLDSSIINRRWVEELKKYPEQFTVHDIYKLYPDGKIDVEKEQQLIEAHQHLILQFPIYWFNCTPLLKKWLDDVFTYGWAYGSSSAKKLKDRKVGLAVSAGISQQDFAEDGRYRYSLQEILRPFEITMNYVDASYQPFFAFYGAEHSPAPAVVNQSALDYIQYLSSY